MNQVVNRSTFVKILTDLPKNMEPIVLSDPFKTGYKGLHVPVKYDTIKDDIQSAKVFLIRHGNSEINSKFWAVMNNP